MQSHLSLQSILRGLPNRKKPTLCLLLTCLILLLNGCHGTTQENTIPPTPCHDGGVLNDEGKCVNPTPCNETLHCLEGFSCTETRCQADIPCTSNAECSGAGVCREGACINPPRCLNNNQCMTGWKCNKTTELCEKKAPCQPGDTTCNQPSCTRKKEREDCRSDEYCFQGACKTEETIKEELQCGTASHPGVFSLNNRACINKESCDAPEECAAGYYCDRKINKCSPVRCVDGECSGGRGICASPSSDQCINKDTCERQAECLSTHVCISNKSSKNECTPNANDKICSSACYGNQKCTYTSPDNNEAGPVSVTCQINEEGCHSGIDCIGMNNASACLKNTMGSGPKFKCQKPPTCSNDAYESNNTAGEAKSITSGQTIEELTLCQDDDWFVYDTSSTSSGEGELAVSLTIDSRFVGVKGVTVEVYNKEAYDQGNQTPLVTRSNNVSGPTPGQIHIVHNYKESSAPTFYIRVSGKEKNTDQLNYALDVFTTKELSSLCNQENIQTIQTFGKPLKGDFEQSASKALKHTCDVSLTEDVSDQVWHLHLDERSNIRVEATPEEGSEGNLLVAIRKTCAIDATELPASCFNTGGDSEAETFNKLLDPGDYYIVVSATDQAKASKYTLLVNKEKSICTPEEDTCSPGAPGTPDTFKYCNATETKIEEVDCTTCSADKKSCSDNAGDECRFAINVENFPYEFKYNVSKYKNKHQLTCTGLSDETFTTGSDVVFKMTVPKEKVLTATSTATGQRSLYMAQGSCGSFQSSCQGVQFQPDQDNIQLSYRGDFYWYNNTGKDVDIYLVSDYSDEGYPSPNEIALHFDIGDKVCDAGTYTCSIGGRQSDLCNPFGTGYSDYTTCENGCGDGLTGRCNPRGEDICHDSGGITLEAGKPITGTFEGLNNKREAPDECGSIKNLYTDTGGKEAVYTFTAKADTTYEITATPDPSTPFDIMVWAATSCDDTGQVGDCEAGAHDSITPGEPETLILPPKTEETTYYIVVEGALGSEKGIFTLDAKEVTTNGDGAYKVLGCDDTNTHYVKYTDKYGRKQRHLCSNNKSCSNDTKECEGGDGKTCMEAIQLYKSGVGAPLTGEIKNILYETLGAYAPPLAEQTDSCYFDNEKRPKGYDAFYRFDLAQSETLIIDFTDDGSDTITYFQGKESCGRPNSCFGAVGAQGSRQLTYQATDPAGDTIYFVIKGASEVPQARTKYSFQWKVDKTPLECAPNSVRCKGTDTLVRCNYNGTEKEEIACACEHDVCTVNPEASTGNGKGCSDKAIPVSPKGGVYVFNGRDYTDFNITTTCGPSDGPNAIYKLSDLPAHSVVTAKVTSIGQEVPTLYFIDGNSCEPDTSVPCLSYQSTYAGSDGVIELSHHFEQGGTYYLAVDTPQDIYKELYYVDIKIEPKSSRCDATHPDSTKITCKDSSYLSYCDTNIEKKFICPEGCTTGKSACNTPSGTTCIDAIPLDNSSNQGGHELQKIRSRTSHHRIKVENQISNSCIFSSAEAIQGEEAYYSIHLDEGDRLDITFQSENLYFDTFTPYLMKGCIKETCKTTSTKINGIRKFSYIADETGTYYFVVDSHGTVHDSFSFTWKKTSKMNTPECVPYQGYCKTSTELEVCTPEGTLKTVACSCKDGVCTSDVSKTEKCDINTPKIIANKVGTNYTAVYSTIVPRQLNPSPTEVCGKGNVDGSTAYYEVTLRPYATLRAAVKQKRTDRGQKTIYPVLFFFTKCDDMNQSCKAFKTFKNYLPDEFAEPLTYQASGDEETIYIGVSSLSDESDGHSLSKFLYVEVDIPELTSSDTPSSIISCESNKLTYYDARGFKQEYSCGGTCEGMGKEARCSDPKGDVCHDPIPVQLDPTTNMWEKTVNFGASSEDTFNLPYQNTCTGNRTPGKDYIFKLSLEKGKTATITVESVTANPDDQEDVAVYLIDNCFEQPKSCFAGADAESSGTNAQPETISYTASASNDETLFIVVDSWNNKAKGDVKVKVSVQ